MATFGTIEPFDMKPGNWLAYEDRVELFLEANSVDDDKKVSTFLSLVGPECYTLVKTLCSPEKPSDKTVTELFGIIREHFCPKKIVIAERYRFHNAKQTKAESIAVYVNKLKKLSENCQFGDFLSEMLRDRFVCGLKDHATLQRLLTEEDLTFQSAVSISSTMEAVAKDSKELHQPSRPQSAGGKSKGDGPPKKGQKGGGPPQQGQSPKGGGPPQQGQFPKGGGPPQQGQFHQRGGPYSQMGSGAPMGGGPYPLGQIPKSDGPFPLGQIPKGGHLMSVGLLDQILKGNVPYLEPQGSPLKACHHCGKNNHPAEACFFKDAKGPECPHCGKYSHTADECYNKNAICPECGKQGHTENVCRGKGKGGNPKGNPGQQKPKGNPGQQKPKGNPGQQKPKGNPGQQKAGQGKKGGKQPTKLAFGVQESG